VNEYASFEDLKTRLTITEPDDDAILRGYMEAASRMWDDWTFRRYYPELKTRYYDHPSGDTTLLKLGANLLSINSLTTANATVTVAAADYNLMWADGYEGPPYNRIQLDPSGTQVYFEWSTTPVRANAVTGVWGWHDDYANAWLDSGDTLAAQITAAATSMTVANVNGPDGYGETPRFKAQQLLKIEGEYLYVVRKSATADTMTVKRGVNGTTAAIHAISTPIYVYQPSSVVRQVVLRLAHWLYRQKDGQFETVMVPELGGISVPAGMPADIKLLIPLYQDQGIA
jgi:hypothetical protein